MAFSTLFLTVSCSQDVEVENTNEESIDNFKLTKVSDISGLKPSQILSFECELITSKPEVATPFCADFGIAIWDISWSTWSADGALGKGLYTTNDCDPDCASGKIYRTSVDLKMEGLYTDGSRYFLRYLNFKADDQLPLAQTNSGKWDVADFYLDSPWMRSDD